MGDADLRGFVTAALAPLLPRDWKWIPFQRNLDAITVPTAMLKLQTVTRTPTAPIAIRDVEYVLTIIEPITDPARGAAALDDHLVDLLGAIDDTPDIAWKTATAVAWGDPNPTNLAYDIIVTTQYTKETSS